MLKDVLKEARHRKGLKQEDVAKLVKVAKQTYLKWENGTTEPKASQVKDLALVLGITPNEICSGKLYKRYSLEDFIYELTRVRARSELETLKSWKHIQDHESFFHDLDNETDEDYLDQKDIHDLLKNS